MTEIKMPFGQQESGRMISIDAVVRGLACECFCPECKSPLVAVKGEIYTHHFRHHSTACEHAAETALHLFAKQAIADEPHLLTLPRNMGRPSRAAVEHMLASGIKPDVHIDYDKGESLAVEIWVAHQVPMDKVVIYERDNQAAIEIDLRRYRLAAKDEAQWRHAVFVDAPRAWLCPPRQLRELLAAQRQAEIKRQTARLEAQRRLALAREAERVEAQRAYDKMIAEGAERAAQHAALARLEAARFKAAQQDREVQEQKERLAKAQREAQSRYAQYILEKRLLAEMTPPSLQEMVRDHGGYNRITPEAWAAYDEAMLVWQERHASGAFWKPPYLELSKEKERDYLRRKRLEKED
jgi:hypothetical protein